MVKEGIEEVQAAWNIRKPGVAQCPDLVPVAWQVLVKTGASEWWCNLPEDWTEAECVEGCQYRPLYAATPDTSTDWTSQWRAVRCDDGVRLESRHSVSISSPIREAANEIHSHTGCYCWINSSHN